MKQLDLFEQCSPEHVEPQKNGEKWLLYVDGAARNNPGPSGAGVYIEKNDKPFYKKGFFIGKKTNNQAEYLALLFGVSICKEHMAKADTLYIMSDSQLLIRQIQGVYKVKNPHLKIMNSVAHALLASIRYSVCHVMRENNTLADALANHGIDNKIPVPPSLITMLQEHNIAL